MTEAADHVVQTLIDIAADLDKTPAQVAFAWILDHPEITAAITGPDLPEHVEEVCGATGWQLDPQARQKLDEVFSLYPLTRSPPLETCLCKPQNRRQCRRNANRLTAAKTTNAAETGERNGEMTVFSTAQMDAYQTQGYLIVRQAFSPPTHPSPFEWGRAYGQAGPKRPDPA